MFRIDDHCKALDQYLDKYQPVRLEDAVTHHLDACLGGEERIKHKRYTDSTMSILYRSILEDSGKKLRIQELIKEITFKAKRSVEEEERQKRRLATLKDKEKQDSLEDTEDSAEKEERADLKVAEGPNIVEKDMSVVKEVPKANNQKSIHSDVDDVFYYNLKDLIKSDFDMPAKDKDFKLSHEQLIKACKILLHKINF